MDTMALFEAGRLQDAIEETTAEVKARPADDSLRVSLFELLCLSGDLERAGKQLDVIGTRTADPGAELAVGAYRGLLAAEQARRAVFHGDGLPKFITQPPPHVEKYVLLLKKLPAASADELEALLDDAEESSPALRGSRGGVAFESFRDADDRVASVLEVFHEGQYLWVPLDQVRRLDVAPPKRARELVWAQADLDVAGQPRGRVFIPTRYVDSHAHANEQVKLARVTEWEAIHDRLVVGHGQRVFLVDGEEASLLDLGEVIFNESSADAA